MLVGRDGKCLLSNKSFSSRALIELDGSSVERQRDIHANFCEQIGGMVEAQEGGGRREIERNPPDKKEIKQKNKIPNGFVRGGDGGGHHTSPCHSRREEHNWFFKRGGGGGKEKEGKEVVGHRYVIYIYINVCVRVCIYRNIYILRYFSFFLSPI